VDVLFSGLMSHAGDVLSHFDCGMVTAPRDELEVVGSTGRLWLDDPWHGREPVIWLDGERIDVPFMDPYACELQELAAVAAGKREARFGRDDAVAQARAIEALYDAAACTAGASTSPED
jgi:hypothetical protein